MAARRKRKASRSGAGLLLFLAGFAVIAVIFVIKLPDIKATLQKTKFVDLVREKTSTTATVPPPAESAPADGARPSSALPAVSGQASGDGAADGPVSGGPGQAAPAGVPAASAVVDANASANADAGGDSAPASAASSGETRLASLFFLRIEDDGSITRHEVKRTIEATGTPLSDALNALLAGPSEAEIRNKLVSLIPRGTKLRGVSIRGSTAYIDLSEPFMYNRYGTEGFTAQLKQIVYTATAFSSVQDVQVLVEGKAKEYLGGEGIYAGKPLSRNSF